MTTPTSQRTATRPRPSRARLHPGDPGYRVQGHTFAANLSAHGLTDADLDAWLPRLIDPRYAAVMQARRTGLSLEAAGRTIGFSRPKAQNVESYVLQALVNARNGEHTENPVFSAVNGVLPTAPHTRVRPAPTVTSPRRIWRWVGCLVLQGVTQLTSAQKTKALARTELLKTLRGQLTRTDLAGNQAFKDFADALKGGDEQEALTLAAESDMAVPLGLDDLRVVRVRVLL